TEIRESYFLGYVFGTFLGDGDAFLNTNGRSEIGRVTWNFGPDEKETAEKLIDCLEVASGVRARIGKSSGRTTTVYFYSLQWARLLATFGKRHEKHLPTRFMCGSPFYLKGLLDGLID